VSCLVAKLGLYPRLIILFLFLAVGCFRSFFHYEYNCIDNPVPDGDYVILSSAFLYWGYDVSISIEHEIGIATIKDVRSEFDVVDTLLYQFSGHNECSDYFGGKYLRFIESSDGKWIILLENPTVGSQFVSTYEF